MTFFAAVGTTLNEAATDLQLTKDSDNNGDCPDHDSRVSESTSDFQLSLSIRRRSVLLPSDKKWVQEHIRLGRRKQPGSCRERGDLNNQSHLPSGTPSAP